MLLSHIKTASTTCIVLCTLSLASETFVPSAVPSVVPSVVPSAVPKVCPKLQEVHIKSVESFFVLEGRYVDSAIRMKPLNDTSDQLWRIRASKRIGTFNVVNVADGKAFDLGLYDQTTDSFNVSAAKLTDSVSQQWFIHSDGSIVSGAALDHAIGPKDGRYEHGIEMVVHRNIRNGTKAAKFVLELGSDC